MKIKALASIIEFDNGQMVVLNPGDEGELSEDIALQKIGAGVAEEVNPEPQADEAIDERKDARVRYTEVTGKAPFAGWSVDQLNAKIAEFEAAAEAKAKAEAEADAAAAAAAAAEGGNDEGGSQQEGGAGDGEEGPPA